MDVLGSGGLESTGVLETSGLRVMDVPSRGGLRVVGVSSSRGLKVMGVPSRGGLRVMGVPRRRGLNYGCREQSRAEDCVSRTLDSHS